MTISMEERFKGRSGSRKNRVVEYLVRGSDDDALIRQWSENNAPSYHDSLALGEISDIKQISNSTWSVKAKYGPLDVKDMPEPEPGTASYTFNMQVEPETFYYSSNRLARFPQTAPQIDNGAIGIQLADGRGRHAGITVPAGPVTDEITYEYPEAVIPDAYRNTVRSLIGGVNDSTWLGSPAGTMRFVSCSASITSEQKQSISFRFAYRPTETVTVGDFGLGSVDGWDFYWSTDETVILIDPNSGAEIPFISPRFVYLERLLPRVSFGTLSLPSF